MNMIQISIELGLLSACVHSFLAGDPTVEQDGYGYTPLNRFGDHFWMLDADIDCSQTENGWFEFKVRTACIIVS